MGTETMGQAEDRIHRIGQTVKLNNPLMGTETKNLNYGMI